MLLLSALVYKDLTYVQETFNKHVYLLEFIKNLNYIQPTFNKHVYLLKSIKVWTMFKQLLINLCTCLSL